MSVWKVLLHTQLTHHQTGLMSDGATPSDSKDVRLYIILSCITHHFNSFGAGEPLQVLPPVICPVFVYTFRPVQILFKHYFNLIALWVLSAPSS